ncbi:MAG: putative phage tail protein [Vicinamibacteria bacterium]
MAGARTQAEWGTFLREHMPPGEDGLDLNPGSELYQMLEELAREWATFDAVTGQLLDELDPRQSSALLEDFERMLALPRDCQPTPTTQAQRQNILTALVTRPRNLTPQMMIDTALAHGFTITIKEFFPETDPADLPLSNRFRYDVTVVGEIDFILFRAGLSGAGDALGQNASLELACLLDEIEPAIAFRGAII